MIKYTFINKITNEPIRVSVSLSECEDAGEIFFFTESLNGFYWFVNTEEEVIIAMEDYVSYIYNTPRRPYWGDINKNDYKIECVEINLYSVMNVKNKK